MSKTCVLCKSDFPMVEEMTDHVITEGVCADCRDAFSSPSDWMSLQQYLDHLDVPVLVMNDDVRVSGCNEAARALLGKTSDEIMGHLGGEALECAYARLPGGCGRTEHCKACTIRRTVTNTHVTGNSHSRETACQSIQTSDGIHEKRFRISTEKVGPFVFLRIDEVVSA